MAGGRGFAFPRSFKGEAALRPSLEANNRVLAAHLNTYVPSYDDDLNLLISGGIQTIDSTWDPSDPNDFTTKRYCDNNSRIKGPTAATAWDDEFDDGQLSADWTTLTVSGAQTLAEANGVLSIHPTSAITATDTNAILKSYAISVGEAVEICFSVMYDINSDPMVAAVISDGTTATSNAAAAGTILGNSGQSSLYEYDGTFTANSGAQQDTVYNSGLMHVRLEYDATNSFKAWWSSDGVYWYTPGAFADTLTPTHVGIGWNTTSAAPIGFDHITVHYFRIVSV